MRNISSPLVSIITPSLNQATYIRKTVESVFTQDYPNVEHIVVDGGSTDTTVEILREYSGRYPGRFRWISEPDDGQSDAFNKGLALARGEIVGWQNSDDYYKPGAFTALTQALHASGAAVAYSGVDCVDSNGAVVNIGSTVPYDASSLVFNYYVCNQSSLIRRDAIDAIGGLDTELHYTMDRDFFLQLSVDYPFAYTPRTYGCFRIHGQSKTGSKRPEFYEEAVHVLDKFFARCQDERQELKEEAYARLHLDAAVVSAAHDRMDMAHAHAALVTPRYTDTLRDPRVLASLILNGPHAQSWHGGSRFAAIERVFTVVGEIMDVPVAARRAVRARAYAEDATLLQGNGQTIRRLRLLGESIALDPTWVTDRRELVVQMLNLQFGERFTRTMLNVAHLRTGRHARPANLG